MMKKAFTMLELVFVIVVTGIVGIIGTEILLKIYNNYITSKVYLKLSSISENVGQLLDKRLSLRIKESVVAKKLGTCYNLGSKNMVALDNDFVLEWIGVANDSFRGDWNGSFYKPNWSGFADISSSETSSTQLKTPQTDTSLLKATVDALRNENSDVNVSAIFFLGQEIDDPCKSFGFDSYNITNLKIIPIKHSSSAVDILDGNFSGIKKIEFYKLAWSAYAIEHNSTNNTLTLYSDYQPWKGISYKNAKSINIISENVTAFSIAQDFSDSFQQNDYIKIDYNITEKILDTDVTVEKKILVY